MLCWKPMALAAVAGIMFIRKVDHGKEFSRGRVYINGLEGFWSSARELLIKHHGVSHRYFPLCLKEQEFRYNHRHEDLFPILVTYICDLVPNLE